MAGLVIKPIGDNNVVTVTNTQPFHLLVHGTDDAGVKITTATLTSNGTVVKGKIIPTHDDKHWAVKFFIKKVDVDHPYTVYIKDSQGMDKTAPDLHFKDAGPGKIVGKGGVKILFDPATGSTVAGSGFWVRGTATMGASVYAYMDQSDSPMYMGSGGDPAPDYSILFENIPKGTEYAITVAVYLSGIISYYVNGNITVN